MHTIYAMRANDTEDRRKWVRKELHIRSIDQVMRWEGEQARYLELGQL